MAAKNTSGGSAGKSRDPNSENVVPHMQALGIIGRMDDFDSDIESWESYFERFEQYSSVNKISVGDQVACLLSVMGPKTYGLLRNLIAPAKPKDKSLSEIQQILQNHLEPKPLLIAERYRFHKRDQREGESITQYIAELKKLASTCDFGAFLSDSLRDRLVCGLTNEQITKRLMTEAELTFAKAQQMAISMETAAKDSKEIFKSHTASSSAVNKLQYRNAKQHNSKCSPKGGKYKCFRCGCKDHNPDNCKFKNELCHRCGKKGHIKKECHSNPKKKGLHAMKSKKNESDSDNNSEDISKMSLYKLKNGSETLNVTMTVEGQCLEMELDTGSAVSVISAKDYYSKFKNIPLKETFVILETYTKEPITPAGVINVEVCYKSQTRVLDLYVVNKGGPPLLGRSWLREINLDWPQIKALHSTNSEANVKQVLNKHKDLFSSGLGTLKGIKATLNLKENASPKFHKPRPVPFARKAKVEDALVRLESQGIIKRVDHSEWAAPIVTPVKKNGDLRVCGDFKVTINPVLKVDQYPLPRIEEIFANLSGGQRFSKIDLSNAYLQMEVSEGSKKYLTVNTHKGLYQYERLVYGVASAPALWQRAMDQVLQGVPMTQCYMDDIVVTGKSDSEHLENLDKVLTRLDQFGLKVNMSKCAFFQEKIEYCGHVIDANGLHKSREKVKAVLEAPTPKNEAQLRSFIGLVNYYQRFLPSIASVLNPLNELLHADKEWLWGKRQQEAFQEAKRLIASDVVLTHYNPNNTICLACDASGYGIGAVISHTMDDGSERPIAFASRTLSSAEKNYSQLEKEGLALVWGVKKFNQYLEGKHFTLITDHQPLTYIFHPHKGIPATAAARLQRWAIFLSGYQYTIIYKNTKSHGNADGLSRLPLSNTVEEDCEPDVVNMFHVSQLEALPVSAKQIRKETRRDPVLAKVLDATMNGWSSKQDIASELQPYWNNRNELSVHEGCLLWGVRVVIPQKLRSRVLDQLHEGHIGVVKMKGLARDHAWWPGIDKNIEGIAKSCEGCQAVQKSPEVAPLHCWEFPRHPWQRVHIDFAGPFH